MKRFLWATALAASAALFIPSQSRAIGIHPDCAHGFPWWQAKVLNKFAWIHMHGPLYNYGPYNCAATGYVWRPYPPIAYHHGYVPAYPAAYSGMGGYYGQGYPQNPTSPGEHHQAAQAGPAVMPQQGGTLAIPTSAVRSPTDYYPTYLGNVWPGVQR